jgi:hypothetical protein
MPKGKHPENALTATRIAKLSTAGRYADGNGLYLVVDKSGAKRWVLRTVVRGRRRDMGLGGIRTVSLAQARAASRRYRATARSGGDPFEERRLHKSGKATEWRPASFPFYEVSEYGDLRLLVDRSTKLAGTILKGSVKKQGYREYKIRIQGKGIHIAAHREVLFAFVGAPPTPDHQCAHWDGDPLNNHYSNLRWATPAENTADKIRHERHRSGRRDFTEEQVLGMRSMHDDGKTYAQIRAIYSISKGNLSYIVNRQTWQHI